MGTTTVDAPAPAQTASDALNAQLNIAPQQFQATQTYAPQYNDLYNQIAQSSLFGDAQSQGLLSTYQQATPILQDIQSQANSQQAQNNVNLVNQLAPQAEQAFQNANPQLAGLQQSLTNMALQQQNPVSMTSTSDWGSQFANQVGSTVAGNQVGAPTQLNGYSPNVSQVQSPGQIRSQNVYATGNSSLDALNQSAQQNLALGSSMSPQQSSTVANQVLSNYNQMGRANDPIAIAALATGEDSYGQQLLAQRQAAASNAAGLTTSQGGLNLTAQQTNAQNSLAAQSANAGNSLTAQTANQNAGLQGSQLNLNALTSNATLGQQANLANQQAALSGLNLQYQGLNSSNQLNLQSQLANQQAQYENAQYQGGLISTAANLAQQTAQNPYQLILGQSGALNAAGAATTNASNTNAGAQSLQNMYNPFANGAFSTIYGGQLQANQSSAANNTALIGSGMSAVGNAL